ncbi:hypothetical protein QUF75_14585 [Desulfococcaceae bacterium HSG7]|nr:hypothetical protein [Desulfococcaceae bacterium HSG7]
MDFNNPIEYNPKKLMPIITTEGSLGKAKAIMIGQYRILTRPFWRNGVERS